MSCKLTEKYDYKYRSWTRNSYSEDKYGFSGDYTDKDLGVCKVCITQDSREKYYLMLDIWKEGIEHHRNYTCSERPTERLAGLKAREFLIEIIGGE